MTHSKQDSIEAIVQRLEATPAPELPERLKDIHELRTGERKPSVPLLFGYPSTDKEIAAYERILTLLRKPARAAKLPASTAPFNIMATHFGGQPYSIAGDSCPECPSCGCSLNFVCQISTNIPFSDGSTEKLLYVLYYCFQCRPPATATEMGFIVGGYWSPSLEHAVPIRPIKNLSAPPLPPQAPVWTREVFYLPSTRELDVEDLGLPLQYYLERFDNFVHDLRESVHVIDGGPYPPNGQFLACDECGATLEVTFTIFLDGVFSIVCCPNHPQFTIGFHTEYADCAAGPVKFEILAD